MDNQEIPVHVVLNTDPLFSVNCLASADVLIMDPTGSFSNLGAALSSDAVKIYWNTTELPAKGTLGQHQRQIFLRELIRRTPSDSWVLASNTDPNVVGQMVLRFVRESMMRQPN